MYPWFQDEGKKYCRDEMGVFRVKLQNWNSRTKKEYGDGAVPMVWLVWILSAEQYFSLC
eukprot:m.244250 g.244250  ORF g.244250 m.244250 type:complete len:59 (-) comp19469_c0_seq6:76-252(-)